MFTTIALAALRKFWPAIPIAVLAAYAGYQHYQHERAEDQLSALMTVNETLSDANNSQERSLAAVSAQRIDNDAIATAVAAKLSASVTHETNTRTIIEKAVSNDPKVADWAATPVPVVVRRALAGDQDGTGTR